MITSLIAAAGLCAAQPGAPALSQSPDIFVEAALDANPRIGEARARVRAARARARGVRAQFRPQVTATLSGGISERSAELEDGGDFEETTSPTTAAVQLNHTVYAGGARALAARNARLNRTRAEIQLLAVEREIVSETMSGYNEWLSARRRIQVERDSAALIAEQIEAAAERLREGAGSRTDLSQARTRLAEVEARLASAIASEQVSRTRLSALTMMETVTPVSEGALFSPAVPASLEEALEFAMLEDPDLLSAELAERQARLAAMTADRRYAPNLALTARAQTVTDPSPLLDRDDEVRATLSLTIPLYAGGARPAERAAALADRDAVRLAVMNLRVGVRARVAAQWAVLESARQSVRAQTSRVEFARVALDGVLEGRDAGLSSTLDILDAERELLAARVGSLDAQAALAQARIDLAASTMSLRVLR